MRCYDAADGERGENGHPDHPIGEARGRDRHHGARATGGPREWRGNRDLPGYVPHTTAGVFINENADPDALRDILATLEALVPWESDYRHAEGNAAAHIKASLVGTSQTVPVRGGRLMLGRWQGIYFADFDGPRERHVQVTVLA